MYNYKDILRQLTHIVPLLTTSKTLCQNPGLVAEQHHCLLY